MSDLSSFTPRYVGVGQNGKSLLYRKVKLVSSDLSTDSFINALRRFIARRGQLQLEIKWRFNPPYASHMGGAWERMIRSVRRILNALTQMQTLTEEGLVTLMTEVEGILNSRPLVPLMLHDSEEEPLTPNHLLLLRGNLNLPPGTFDTNSCYTRRRWAQVQFLANQFWRRWAKEFLPNLLQRQKWFNRNRNFEVGDVVLLVEDMQHRSNWVVGRVIRTLTDKEGLVRVVQVKARNTVLTRPVTKLCLIEKTAR